MQIPFHCALCPTDLSETGNAAVDVAYRLVGQGGTVHLLHVGEPPYLGNPLYVQYVQGWMPDPEDVEAGEERVRAKLHRLPPEDALSRGIRTEYHVIHGVNVAGEIEHLAREIGVDAVVMGSHGRTGLGRLVMGSVASEVIRRDGLPVILVHADVGQPARVH
jgi:nucleotide-binding universal stress UspA family protein